MTEPEDPPRPRLPQARGKGNHWDRQKREEAIEVLERAQFAGEVNGMRKFLLPKAGRPDEADDDWHTQPTLRPLRRSDLGSDGLA